MARDQDLRVSVREVFRESGGARITAPISWNAWLARLLPPIPVPLSRRPPDDAENLTARQMRRESGDNHPPAVPPPDTP